MGSETPHFCVPDFLHSVDMWSSYHSSNPWARWQNKKQEQNLERMNKVHEP